MTDDRFEDTRDPRADDDACPVCHWIRCRCEEPDFDDQEDGE